MFHLLQERNKYFFFLFIAILLLGSCTVVKNYPEGKPFVYENKITVKGEVSKDEIKRLQLELYNYWDDSLKVNSLLKFGVRTVIKNPAVFDSSRINRSIVFMNSFLNSQGYYNAVISPAPVSIDTVENQLRATVQMDIDVNKNLKIDSISYDSLIVPDFKKLINDNKKQSLLAKNKPFTKTLISNELDRITTLFRSNGYYKFTRDNIFAEVDTADLTLLEVTLIRLNRHDG